MEIEKNYSDLFFPFFFVKTIFHIKIFYCYLHHIYLYIKLDLLFFVFVPIFYLAIFDIRATGFLNFRYTILQNLLIFFLFFIYYFSITYGTLRKRYTRAA